MDLRDQANELLATAADILKLEKLELNERNECIVTFDDRIVTLFTLDSDSLNGLVVTLVLGGLTAGAGKEELMYELLAGNYAWNLTEGGVIGVDRATGVISLCYLVELPMNHPEQFPNICAKLLNVADFWMRKINEFGGVTGNAEAATPLAGTDLSSALRV